jgi:hypothetical protein
LINLAIAGQVRDMVAGGSLLHIGQKIEAWLDGETSLPEQARIGAGLRAGFRPTAETRTGVLGRFLRCDLFLGFEYDETLVDPSYVFRHYGGELRLAGVVSFRYGRYCKDYPYSFYVGAGPERTSRKERVTRGIGIGL